VGKAFNVSLCPTGIPLEEGDTEGGGYFVLKMILISKAD
jgi:hypothetical protein